MKKIPVHGAVDACAASDKFPRGKLATARVQNGFYSLVDRDGSAQKVVIEMVYTWGPISDSKLLRIICS